MIFEKKRTQLDECTVSVQYDGIPTHGFSIEESFMLYKIAGELNIDSEKKLFELGVYNYTGSAAKFGEDKLIEMTRRRVEREIKQRKEGK